MKTEGGTRVSPTGAERARSKRGKLAHASGLRAEMLASLLLRFKLYRILARRLKTKAGEIDLVARRGRTLVFVEVKTRQDPEIAAGSIAPHQQSRLARAASLFVARNPQWQDFDIRFDVVLVCPGRLPQHLPDAWRP